MQVSIPQIIRDTDQVRRLLRSWRKEGETIALASVKGGPHGGHLGLLETAHRHASKVVVSVSDNFDMTQAALLGRASCDLIFAPYIPPHMTMIRGVWCGMGDMDAREKVATNVARLFGQVQPDVAVFGERDWLELAMIRQMVRDLEFPIGIVSSATVRDEDGLAISSQTELLTEEERNIAPTLYKVLTASAKLIARGSLVGPVTQATQKFLSESGFSSVDYVSVRRAHDIGRITRFDPAKPARLFASVQLGRVRLTDNVPIAG